MEQHSQPTNQEHVTDDQRIHHGIIEALRDDRPIDHATARAIAARLHGGQASPLYALASSGALVAGLGDELDTWRQDERAGLEVEPWLDALDEYVTSRASAPDPVDGWANLWPGDPPRDTEAGAEAEIAAIRELLRPVSEVEPEGFDAFTGVLRSISTGSVRTLGEVATVTSVGSDDEIDDFPWIDAAEWRASEAARDSLTEPRYSEEEMTALFRLEPDDQVGSVWQIGWYGLLRHQDKPGGLILTTDTHGFRHVRQAEDNGTLEQMWAGIRSDYDIYLTQRDAYELATDMTEQSPSGLNPQIWVGSLADYNNGRLHGVWMDATLEPDELEAATQFMLRNGYTPGAEDWAIMDHQDFGGYNVGEYASFRAVSLIAQGIALHGPAFGKWVEHVGEQSESLLTTERFNDHYQGEFDSAEDFVDYYLSETDSLDFMRFMPDSVKHYIKVDLEMYARDWQSEGLLVEELETGRVAVFLMNW